MLQPTRKIKDTSKTNDDEIRRNIVSYLHAKEMIFQSEKGLELALLGNGTKNAREHADAIYYWKSNVRDFLEVVNLLFEGQEIPELFQLAGKAYAALIVEDGIITHITTTTLIEEMSKSG